MHPNAPRSPRRVHGAELKARVLAQCHEPQASVAAVALAHGLNANLVRKWLAGRGLKRSGLSVDGAQPERVTPVMRPLPQPTPVAPAAPSLQFVPVGLAAPSHDSLATAGVASCAGAPMDAAHIQVELRAGGACLAVRWPLSQASGCAAWLGELAGAVLKR